MIDGDTIEINKEKIRFANIDAPEMKQICIFQNIEVFCGNLAKIVLEIKIGKEVMLLSRFPRIS